MTVLTNSQKAAITHIDALSQGPMIDINLRVTLNFHPDRVHKGLHILDAIAKSGVYKSQFETSTSNGGLTAHHGGDRWNWESRIFGNAYDTAPPAERPKYGALNYRKYDVGGSPRFGSAHLRLKQAALQRTTFCYPDSVFEPEEFGTQAHMPLIEHALADDKDILDNYIEAQIHGELRIAEDVEALVLDPCYKGTEVEMLARQLTCPIEWHRGFSLAVTDMIKYPDYRGVEFIEIGKAIAENGIITPFLIGKAAAAGKYATQDLKKVWHHVARFGHEYQ